MVRTILAVMFCWVFTSAIEAQAQSLSLMPMPAKVQMGSGQLVVDPNFSVSIAGHHEARLDRAVELFLVQLRRQTGMPPIDMKVTNSATATLVIQAAGGTKAVQELGEDESYRLEIASSGARLSAPTTLGVMRGLQTFLQLVRTTSAWLCRAGGFDRRQPALSLARIDDRRGPPLYPARRSEAQSGRHGRGETERVSLASLGKPGLPDREQEISQAAGHGFGRPVLHPGTSPRTDRVCARARHSRGPRIRHAGHATAWFVGYPELASGPGPYQIERQWGVFDPAMDPTREETYKFLDTFIGEMAGIFPDQFFHIGGDEVNGKEWDANPKIQAFMRAHGMKNNDDLQAYFNQRVQKIVAKHGKTMLGWDEILRPICPRPS